MTGTEETLSWLNESLQQYFVKEALLKHTALSEITVPPPVNGYETAGAPFAEQKRRGLPPAADGTSPSPASDL